MDATVLFARACVLIGVFAMVVHLSGPPGMDAAFGIASAAVMAAYGSVAGAFARGRPAVRWQRQTQAP